MRKLWLSSRVKCLVDSAMEKREKSLGGQKKAENGKQVKMEMSFEMRYEFLYVPTVVKYFGLAKLFSFWEIRIRLVGDMMWKKEKCYWFIGYTYYVILNKGFCLCRLVVMEIGEPTGTTLWTLTSSVTPSTIPTEKEPLHLWVMVLSRSLRCYTLTL